MLCPSQALKQQRSKQSKQKWGGEVAAQKAIDDMEAAQQAELLEYDRTALAEVGVAACMLVLDVCVRRLPRAAGV